MTTCACPDGVRCYSDEPPFGVDETAWPSLCRSGGWSDPPPRRVNEQGRDSKTGVPVETVPLTVPRRVDTAPMPSPAAVVEAPPQPRLFAVAEPPPKRKPVTALSPSSAKKLQECPRRFEFNKVLGRPEPTGKAAAVGVFVHKVLELLTGNPLTGRTEPAAKALAGDLWADIAQPPGSPVMMGAAEAKEVEELRGDLVQLRVVDDAGAVSAFKRQAWAAIRYGVEIEPDYGGDVAYRELWIEGVEVAGVPVRMKVDRIDRHPDGLAIVDYKSGKYPQHPDGRIDQEKLNGVGDQLLWYWPAVETVTKEKVRGALLAYVGEGAQVVLWVDPGRLEGAKKKLAWLWRQLAKWEQAAVERGEPYPAKASYLCGWCPFFAECQPGSAFLLDNWAWSGPNGKRAREGKPPVPARVEIDSWAKPRLVAWQDFARGDLGAQATIPV